MAFAAQIQNLPPTPVPPTPVAPTRTQVGGGGGSETAGNWDPRFDRRRVAVYAASVEAACFVPEIKTTVTAKDSIAVVAADEGEDD